MFLEWMSWKATLLGLSKALRSVSSTWGGSTGCQCTASIWLQMQELVILWVTLPSGWDTSPDWGHELVLDLLPGVLFEVCLDGTRLRNLPLQFCAVQNKSHECRGANWREDTQVSSLIILPPPHHTRALLFFFHTQIQALPYLDPSSCPIYHTTGSSQSPPFPIPSAGTGPSPGQKGQGTLYPPVTSSVPPCSPCNQECKRGDGCRAPALEATLPVKVNSTSF